MKRGILLAIVFVAFFATVGTAGAARVDVKIGGAADAIAGTGNPFAIDIFISEIGALEYDTFNMTVSVLARDTASAGKLGFSSPIIFEWGAAVPIPAQAYPNVLSDTEFQLFYAPFLPGTLPTLTDGRIVSIKSAFFNGLGTYDVVLSDVAFYKGSSEPDQPAIYGASVSSVPIPSAFMLLGSGLFGLMALRRKRM